MPVRIVALCVVLAVFCSQEGLRPPLADGDFSYIHRFIYEHNYFDEVFICMMIVTAFLFRRYQRGHPFQITVIGACVYFSGRLVLSQYMALVAPPFSYHAISQTGLVLVAGYLTVQIARRCAVVDELVETLFVPAAARFDFDLDAATEKARGILQYCRRNGHAAGVLILKPDLSADEAVFPEIVRRMVAEAARSAITLKVASRVAHGLRRTDILVHRGEKGGIVVICPEADNLRLQAMIQRITDDVSGTLGIPLRTGSAHFPEDALTYDDLLRVAGGQIDQKAGTAFSASSDDCATTRSRKNSVPYAVHTGETPGK